MTAKQPLWVDQVSVRLGGKPILQDISFTAERGEFIGIIGPNGAGKSTLLRSLRGLCPVSSGQIHLFGRPIRQMNDKQMARSAAYMQQEVNAGFGFTALEVVLAGRYPYLQWWQNESEADYRIAKKYMAFTGVEELADRPVQQVSGGERQRILLAKVLAQETPFIFLDEPTASLDLTYQEEIFRYCQVISKQGKTVLLIAHDIKLAAKFCSRLILLAGGGMIADGPPREVITVENLSKAYGLNAAVFINTVTGSLDIHTYEAGAERAQWQTVHVIGGGGSAGGILRLLHEKSYRLTSGVLQQGDTDADVAAAFGADRVVSRPFCAIDKLRGSQNREKIAAADWAVLTNLYYGEQNLDNLEAAFVSRRLIVIEDSPVELRDFTGGQASRRYKELVQLPQVTVMTSAEFSEKMSRDITLCAGGEKI
jgi:iron complex transport system ATP-binding protein